MRKAYLLIFSLLFMPSISYSAGHNVYLKEKVAGKNNMIKEYGISGSWITECTRDQPYGRLEEQSCELRLTNGKKWSSGIYQDAGPTPVVSITYLHPYGEKPRRPLILVKMGYLVADDTEMNLTVGGKHFSKFLGNDEPYRAWQGNEAIQIISLFIKSNSARYAYLARNGRQSGTASLRGFTSAWNYAVKFTGINPFK